MTKPIILLDPGHGATDFKPKGKFSRPLMTLENAGTSVKQICGAARHEKDSSVDCYREDLGTQLIAKSCSDKLIKLGIQDVYLTRTPEYDVNPNVYLAEKLGSNAFQRLTWGRSTWIRKYAKLINSNISIAIHTNAGGGRGCTAFYASNSGRDLADFILKRISNRLNIPNRGSKMYRYGVLLGHSSNNTCLVECAFHDNPIELGMLLNPICIEKFGSAIAEGIYDFSKVTVL